MAKANSPRGRARSAEEASRKAELVGQTRAEFVSEKQAAVPPGNRRGVRHRASKAYDELVKKTEAVQKAAPVYRELMGRDMDDAAKSSVWEMGVKKATRHWATSREALSRGVDPTQYGARAVDEGSISEKDRPYYDEWRKRNPGQPLYDTTLEYLGWARGQGDVNAFTAELDGLIVDHYIEGQRVRQITPEAVQRMGGEITIRGSNAGAVWIAPEGVKWHGGNTWQTTETGEGHEVRMALGNPSDGVFGLGSDALKWLPKEVSAPLNLLTANTIPRILGGTDALRSERQEQRRMFGDSAVEFLEPLSEMVITTAATVAGGPKGTLAASTAFQGSRAMSGEQGLGDAGLRIAAATAPIAGAQYGAVGAGIGAAAGVTAGRIVGDNDLNPFLIAASGLTAYTFAPYSGHWATDALSGGIQAGITRGPILASTVMGAAGGVGHWANFSVATAGALLDSDNRESYAHLAMGNLAKERLGGEQHNRQLTTRDALQGTWDHVRNPGQAWSDFTTQVSNQRFERRERASSGVTVEGLRSAVVEDSSVPFEYSPPPLELSSDIRSRIDQQNRERMLRSSERTRRDRAWEDRMRESDRIREANSYQGPSIWGR